MSHFAVRLRGESEMTHPSEPSVSQSVRKWGATHGTPFAPHCFLLATEFSRIARFKCLVGNAWLRGSASKRYYDSIVHGKEIVIRPPKIAVRSTGALQWSVTTEEHGEAQHVRETFSGRGLSCGPITKKVDGFAFTADAWRSEAESTRGVGQSGVF
jgi:hypothetical protein